MCASSPVTVVVSGDGAFVIGFFFIILFVLHVLKSFPVDTFLFEPRLFFMNRNDFAIKMNWRVILCLSGVERLGKGPTSPVFCRTRRRWQYVVHLGSQGAGSHVSLHIIFAKFPLEFIKLCKQTFRNTFIVFISRISPVKSNVVECTEGCIF